MSNKEEKRRRREAKQQAAKRRAKLQRVLVIAAVAVLVPLALYVFYQGLFGGAPTLPPAEVAASDHVRGAPDAELTMTMYADFQCPACLTEAQLIAQAWPRIQNDVRVVFRHFPLDSHRHAFLAARYAEAAGRQGRFWDMHDILFARQQDWALLEDAQQVFSSYALELGLDMERLMQDLDAEPVLDKIRADQRGGLRAGVRGTPSLFFNGEMVSNPMSAGQLIQMVNRALEEA